MNRLVLITLASTLLACGGGNTEDTTASANPCGANPCEANPCGANPCEANPCEANPCGANPCGGNPCEAAGPMDVGVDWSGWQSWTKVHESDAFASKGHKKPWVSVYVPAEHVEAYKSGADMPQGVGVVKAVHKDVNGTAGEVQMLTVMAKMGSDYDPENGNWYYGALSADGSKAMKEGKLPMCINCHGSGDDYLFGKTTSAK